MIPLQVLLRHVLRWCYVCHLWHQCWDLLVLLCLEHQCMFQNWALLGWIAVQVRMLPTLVLILTYAGRLRLSSFYKKTPRPSPLLVSLFFGKVLTVCWLQPLTLHHMFSSPSNYVEITNGAITFLVLGLWWRKWSSIYHVTPVWHSMHSVLPTFQRVYFWSGQSLAYVNKKIHNYCNLKLME